MKKQLLLKLFLSLTILNGISLCYAAPDVDTELLKKRTLCLDIDDINILTQMGTKLYNQVSKSSQPVSLGFINAYTFPLNKAFDFNGVSATYIIFAGGGAVGVVFSKTDIQKLAEQYQLKPGPFGIGYERKVIHNKTTFQGWENYSVLHLNQTQDKKYVALSCFMDTQQVK